MSEMTVVAALASYPSPVTLREPRWNRYADIAGALGAMAIGYKIGTGTVACPPAGAAMALAAGLMLVVALRDLRRAYSLTLNANGFQLCERREHVTVPWVYVQHFREVGDDAFAVGFDLVVPGGAAADSVRLPDSFGLTGPDLLALLTQWHARALGLAHPRRRFRRSID